MEFKCRNEQCENKDISVLVGECHYKMVGDKLLADERFCLFCKQEMEEIKDKDGWKNLMVGTPIGSPTKNWNKVINGNKKVIY